MGGHGRSVKECVIWEDIVASLVKGVCVIWEDIVVTRLRSARDMGGHRRSVKECVIWEDIVARLRSV
ncbi:hypothetical protein RRG08_066460 [Elysia crispata]|uniref:Uncharacterized protein n=1 Tax=Elysia crispata TaxID=231223 RepID=A0AAE1E6T9_9GAST|nr:hypothetical protein RRG08_066460 [Elysia crispata]